MRGPQNSIDEEDDEEGGSSVDPEVLKSYVSFAARALRQRRPLMALIFVPAMLLVGLAVYVWPRTYSSETKLIAQNTGALSGGRVDDPANRPFDDAAASIMQYENLKAIVKQAELVKYWDRSRSRVHRLKDVVFKRITGEPSDEDKAAVLVAMLQGRLSVDVSNGILTIGASWPDPQLAARLVEETRQNFLEMRHVNEISMLAENIAILEGHVSKVRNEIYEIAKNVEKLREERREKLVQAQTVKAGAQPAPDAAAPRPQRAALPAAATAGTDESVASLKVLLEAKQQALKELEGERARNLKDLEGKLRELKLTYTDAHPEVVHVRMSMASLQSDSPQVAALRGEVANLENELDRRTRLGDVPRTARGGAGGGVAARGSDSSSSQLPSEVINYIQDSVGEIDPTVMAQFRLAVGRYSDLQDRINSAHIELDRAQAAFKHRYKIMMPAEVPNAPTKPNVRNILLGGLAGSFLFAFFAALIAELSTGRLVERWQVQQLQLPILAELKLPPDPRG